MSPFFYTVSLNLLEKVVFLIRDRKKRLSFFIKIKSIIFVD